MTIVSVFNWINQFFQNFGSPIVISIILFFICLAFKIRGKNAFLIRDVCRYWVNGLHVDDQ